MYARFVHTARLTFIEDCCSTIGPLMHRVLCIAAQRVCKRDGEGFRFQDIALL